MKTVLITGASRGIGKALAQKFLSNQYFVIGTSVSGTADLNHPNLHMLSLDLGDSISINNCAQKVFNLKKSIDILINNAATIFEKPQETKIDADALRKTLEVDLIGAVALTELLLPIISTGGHIINISSRQGSLNYPLGTSTPSYKIAKAALNMFTRVLSYQLGDKAIVSSVHPGSVKSGLGAPNADMSAEESADDIYDLAISKPETGQFWFKGKKFPW